MATNREASRQALFKNTFFLKKTLKFLLQNKGRNFESKQHHFLLHSEASADLVKYICSL